MTRTIPFLFAILFAVVACDKKPAKTTPGAKPANLPGAGAETLSPAMPAEKAIAAFHSLSEELNGTSENNPVDLGALLRTQGMSPSGACAGKGQFRSLEPLDVDESGEKLEDAAKASLGLIAVDTISDEMPCLKSSLACAITLVPGAGGQFHLRAAPIELGKGEGPYTPQDRKLLAPDTWVLFLRNLGGEICAAQSNEPERDPYEHGEEAIEQDMKAEASHHVDLILFHRGRMTRVFTAPFTMAQQTPHSRHEMTMDIEVHVVPAGVLPGAGPHYLLTIHENVDMTSADPMTRETTTEITTTWSCHRFSTDGQLHDLAESEVTALKNHEDTRRFRCGETEVTGSGEEDHP